MVPASTEFYTLSLHDALPILNSVLMMILSLSARSSRRLPGIFAHHRTIRRLEQHAAGSLPVLPAEAARSEEHTSELQSQFHLVCRLLLEKKKKKHTTIPVSTA